MTSGAQLRGVFCGGGALAADGGVLLLVALRGRRIVKEMFCKRHKRWHGRVRAVTHTHHVLAHVENARGILELLAVVGRREDGDEVTIREELVALVDHLVRAYNARPARVAMRAGRSKCTAPQLTHDELNAHFAAERLERLGAEDARRAARRLVVAAAAMASTSSPLQPLAAVGRTWRAPDRPT